MMTFEELIQKDLDTLYDVNYFAKLKTLYFDSGQYEVRAIVNDFSIEARKRPSGDSAVGLSAYDLIISFPEVDLGFIPQEGLRLEFDDALYEIEKANCVHGEITLGLKRYDE